MKRALFLAFIGPFLLLPTRGGLALQAQTPVPDALTFFKNFFVTGDYVVGGTGLTNTGVNGVATGSIGITGVPAGADVQAAYLYWQVVSTDTLGPDSGSVNSTFKGYPLVTPEGPVGKVLGPAGSSPCWSSGGGTGTGSSKRTYTFRADVLRYFDVGTDGKVQVNGNHAIQVPDSGGNGNALPIAVGASLVVVYRSLDPAAKLSAIVIYDGSYTVNNSTQTLFQTIKGFYQPATTTPDARITYIAGSGQANKSENLYFDGSLISSNAFSSSAGNAWDNPTFAVNPGTDGTVTTSLDASVGSSDCLNFGAIVFKTAVKDTDHDGLLDAWEDSTTSSPVYDPNGVALPPLGSMGADKDVKDIFVEVGYMETSAQTSYGGVSKDPHSHMPTHESLKLVGEAFKKEGIKVHFDVGDEYPFGSGTDLSKNAEEYLIPRGTGFARGGDAIDESVSTLCTSTGAPWDCQFSAYPGTVGWKTGFRYLRDEVLSDEPAPLPGEDDPCDAPGATCERRFDRNRKDIFHYALFAHALGLPKSESPCLDATGNPTGANDNDRCDVAVNPAFRIPRTTTGVGDFPGGDVLVTLGGFPDTAGLPIGTPFMVASTLMHELGHNFERRHSGEASTPASPNPNCKPTYLSVMNYLYQLRGLLDDSGKPNLDFSGAVGPALNETTLADGTSQASWQLSGPYRIGWYAPLLGSYLEGRGTAARSHCDGSALLRDELGALTEPAMVRIDARRANSLIDWNANGNLTEVGALDINFNGRTTATPAGGGSEQLRGSNDWANIRLNQVGSRRSIGGLFRIDELGNLRLGALSMDAGRGDYGRGDYGRGDYGRGDLGRGDYGRGDYGRGDYGRGDLGRGDYGGGDLFARDPNNIGGELDAETAGDLAKTPPTEFEACVIGVDCTDQSLPLNDVRFDFKASNVGGVVRYVVYRVAGAELRLGQEWTKVHEQTAGTSQIDYVAYDDDELVNSAQYTYFAVAEYEGGVQSDASNLVTITAFNAPLAAGPDAYDATEDTVLTIAAAGVLANDSDPDSPTGALTASLVDGPLHGSVTLNADGSFTYTPDANYNGGDTFTYTATNGSVTTAPATVTIAVAAVNDLPVAAGDALTVAEDSGTTGGNLATNDTPSGDGGNVWALATGTANGTAVVNADGTYTYAPAENSNGTDSFTYTLTDTDGDVSTATVTITVTSVDDLPSAAGDALTVAEDSGTTGGNLATNDTPSGDGGNAWAIATGAAHGAAVVNADGTFTYTPAANFNGADSFTYTLTDADGDVSTATVSITVTSVNDLPTAGSDAYTTIQETALTILAPGVLGNDSDIDGTLTAVLASGPANGTVTLSANGSFTYTPGAGFYGVDSFSYNAWDGTNGTTATVTITVERLQYVFTGFLSPMVTAGTESSPSNAGVFSFGKAIPLKWTLSLGGSVVSDLASLTSLVAVSGTYTPSGGCNTSGGTTLQLLDPSGRPTGNSTYRFGSGQFIFNWDTSAAVRTSCYVIKLTLNDGSPVRATFIRFR